MSPYIALSIHFIHHEIDPQYIYKYIPLSFDIIWKKGDRRHSPDGQILPGFYDKTYLCAKIELTQNITLEEALAIGAQQLEPYKTHIAEFIDGGGRVEFFVGWLRGPGAILEPQLLRRLADLGVVLSLDVYLSKD